MAIKVLISITGNVITAGIILRDGLRDLLYSRHTLPYLHYRVVLQFLLGSQDQSLHPEP